MDVISLSSSIVYIPKSKAPTLCFPSSVVGKPENKELDNSKIVGGYLIKLIIM